MGIILKRKSSGGGSQSFQDVLAIDNEFTIPLEGASGSALAPTYSFLSDTNTGIFRSGADSLGFSTGGNARAVLDSTGLGIGTTSPDAPLHIHGTAVAGRETFMKVSLSDSGNDQFGIANGTSASGEFAPSFFGYKDSDDDIYSMNFRGMLDASSDASDSSGFGVINMETYRTTNAADPNNGTLSRVLNRKVFTLVNGAGGNRTFPVTVLADDTFQLSGQLTVARLTTTQKNALTAVEGSLVYDTTLNKLQVRDNTTWVSLH